jgi:Tfp pilus assembly protein PilF/4-amino-4-deoxy-L-arabinose transferase-like glycosyltransferase
MGQRSNRVADRTRAQRRREPTADANRLAAKTTALWFSAIFAIALLLRFVHLWQIEAMPLFYNLAGDGRTYDEWAQRIAGGDWLGSGVFYQAPLYPYFLAVWQFIFGHNLWLIRFLQILLGALSCASLFLVGEKLFSRSTGVAAGLALAIYAPAIFFDALIEKSILDLTLLCLMLCLLADVGRTHYLTKWLGIGSRLGLLGLSRENALILAPLVAIWILVALPREPPALRTRSLGCFLAGLLFVLVPVGLRNLIVGGEFTLTTSQLGPNFFIGNNPVADGTYGSVRQFIKEVQLEGPDAKRLAERASGRALPPGEVSGYWLRQSTAFIEAQPGQWLKLLGRKWLLVWHAREIEDSDDFYIYRQFSAPLALFGWFAHFGVLAPLAAVGIFFTWREWRRLWLLHAMILALAGSVALFYVFGRYRYPLVPFLALFAGVAIVEWIRLLRQKNWSLAIKASIVLAITAGVVNWPLGGASGPGAAGYNNLANAYAKQGDVDLAIGAALRALEIEPDYGVAHYNLGNLYMQQGRFDLARRHFEEALRLLPNYAEAHSNYGQLLAEGGDLATGMEHFQKAIALNPSVSRAHLNFGVALAKTGRMDDAIAPLQQAAALSPEAAEPIYYLGSVYAAQNRYAEAEAAFNQAVRLRPDFAPAHQSLAHLLELQGRKAQALQHYQESVRLMKQGGMNPSIK